MASKKQAVKLDLSQKGSTVLGTTGQFSPDKLDSREVWWRDRYEQLKSRGYLLRPRYAPSWVPSWSTSNKDWDDCEDSKRLVLSHIIDATRISDGKKVTLKRISRTEHPYEVDVGLYFSSEALSSLPSNHCVPIFEVFNPDANDDIVVMVMPLLRPYTDPHFDTIGEAVECFRQLFQGLQFMHEHHVAHRDCMKLNIMMDPSLLYPKSYHPVETSLSWDCKSFAKHLTRTQRPPKYYFIDFGISRRYDPLNTNPLEPPIWGGDKEVPEFQNSNEPRNPFPTDVFYLGNALRQDFLLGKQGFEFMAPLIAGMVQTDPAKRLKMDEVITQFDEIRRLLSDRKIRSRAVDVNEDLYQRITRTTSHWRRRIGFIATGVPAVRSPR